MPTTRLGQHDADIDADALWRRFAKNRCAHARERLILHYWPLVHFVASRVGAGVPGSVERGDLVSFGVIGLIEAVDRFDLSRNVKFETYAVGRIRGAMLDELRALDWVPRSIRSTARRLEYSRSKLRAELMREPTAREIAADLDADARIVRDAGIASLVGLEELVAVGGGEDGDHVTVLDTIPDDADELLGSDVEAEQTRAALLDAMSTLGEREYRMIAMYYFHGFTLSRIGKMFGVTESRVSQIHSKALTQLGRYGSVRALGEANGWNVPFDRDTAHADSDERRIA